MEYLFPVPELTTFFKLYTIQLVHDMQQPKGLVKSGRYTQVDVYQV